MNSPHLADIQSLHSLRAWMENVCLNTLWDISCWDNSRWSGWKRLQVPLEIMIACDSLLALLHGKAPIHTRRLDKRGCGQSGSYSMALGYAK